MNKRTIYHHEYYLKRKNKSIEYYLKNKDEIIKKQKEYYRRTIEKRKQYAREYAKRYVGKSKEERSIYQKEYRLKNKERLIKKERAKSLISKYGINTDDYNKMLESQNGKCAICGKHQLTLRRVLSVDHNHKTGAVRGLLCYKCNTGISNFHEDIDIILNALNYLRKNC